MQSRSTSISIEPAFAAIAPKAWKPQPFMPVNSQVYSEIQQFLIYEALLLDHCCFDQWSALLSRDITYSVCNCFGQRQHDHCGASEYVDSGRDALLQRTGRQLQIANLPSTRRFVTNVSVSFAHCRNEYEVVSYLRVMHISHEGSANSAWSAERRDRLRATDRSFAILRREVLIDSLEPGIAGCPRFL
jgi:3-phenylpropionate/cinnamic acid dioxygenase small subunit